MKKRRFARKVNSVNPALPKRRSKFEERVETALSGYSYETVKLKYVVEHTYNPDWCDAERKVILETKGRWVSSDRSKIKAVLAQNPDWHIVMVFQAPTQKITKTSKTSYVDWCSKNGIWWTTESEVNTVWYFRTEEDAQKLIATPKRKRAK